LKAAIGSKLFKIELEKILEKKGEALNRRKRSRVSPLRNSTSSSLTNPAMMIAHCYSLHITGMHIIATEGRIIGNFHRISLPLPAAPRFRVWRAF
jgi:hypothetical protein